MLQRRDRKVTRRICRYEGVCSLGADAPIGVFDSGSGGLTVVREIRKILPNESVLYFADTGRLPYGTRPQSQISRFSVEISEFLLAQGAKAIVIACNTATAAGLGAVQSSFPGPVVGVIRPGSEAAMAVGGSGSRVGLIATEATVASGVYDQELAHLGLRNGPLKQACPDFVMLVEAGQFDEAAVRDAARRYMKVFHESPVDVLIMGCTHFPLLAGYIEEALPGVELIDPAVQTVMTMKAMLEERELLSKRKGEPEYKFFCSGDPMVFRRNLVSVLGEDSIVLQAAV